MGKEKAFGGTKAEDMSQGGGSASCYPKAIASSSTCVSVLLEAL
jgi:hypothetical protein